MENSGRKREPQLEHLILAPEEGVRQLEYLRALELRNRDLEDKERLLTASHQIGRIVLETLDLDKILDRLATRIIEAGLFRSLMVALVHAEEQLVEVVRNYVCLNGNWNEDAQVTPGQYIRVSDRVVLMRDGRNVDTGRRITGTIYPLDDDNVTPTTARTGRMEIIEEWSERFDQNAGDAQGRRGKVAYFIPVKKGDRVLAVLATGSEMADKEKILRRIEMMQPLLDYVAIALDHARLYAGIQREVDERRRMEEELAAEQQLREAENVVRLKIASMDLPEDLFRVVQEIGLQLGQLGVEHDSATIQIVNAAGTDFVSVAERPDGRSALWRKVTGPSWGEPTQHPQMFPWVLEVWRSQRSRYQPSAPAGSGNIAGYSLIDVPFSRGTLAINSRRSNAFDEARVIPLLERFAQVLSAGFQRFEDIVNRQRMEQELVRLERLRAVGELSAGISHNLNNILTNVLGPAQLLRRLNGDPQVLREADEIIAAASRARDLVHRLHLSVRSAEEELQPVRVDAVVREAAQATRPRWKDQPEARGIAVELITQLEETPLVRGTSTGLYDVITNLIFNAVDAMPRGGIIRIRTRMAGEEVELEVTDTGAGMGEETRLRVFEPFFTTKMNVGTGLGLSMAYRTVHSWGGEIRVESAPGKGTTFTLHLPVWRAEEAEPPRRGRVLIAEDDARIRMALTRILNEKYEVEIAESGRDALAALAPGRFAAALIDLGLPGAPGDQVARQLRRLDPAVAIVLITGWILDPDDPRLAFFDFWLQKPFSGLDQVEQAVARAVELTATRR